MKRNLAIFAMIVVALVGVVSAVSAHEGRGGPGRGAGSDIITEQTGLTAEEIREQLQAGSTLAEIIEANGGDIDAVAATMIDAATEHISTAVEEGRMTQEQADERLAELEQKVTDRLNGTFEPGEHGPRRNGRGSRGEGRPNANGGTAEAPAVEATTDL